MNAALTLEDIQSEASALEMVPRLLDADAIADLMGLKDKRQVYRLVSEKKFPEPSISVGRYKRWRATEYIAWVEARAKAGRKRR